MNKRRNLSETRNKVVKSVPLYSRVCGSPTPYASSGVRYRKRGPQIHCLAVCRFIQPPEYEPVLSHKSFCKSFQPCFKSTNKSSPVRSHRGISAGLSSSCYQPVFYDAIGVSLREVLPDETDCQKKSRLNEMNGKE